MAWVKGQSGNPKGRAPRVREQAYQDATYSSVPISKWRKVVKRALEQALEGDDKARAFLAKYLLPAKREDAPEQSETEKLFTALLHQREAKP